MLNCCRFTLSFSQSLSAACAFFCIPSFFCILSFFLHSLIFFASPHFFAFSHIIFLHPLIFLHHLIILPVSVRSMCNSLIFLHPLISFLHPLILFLHPLILFLHPLILFCIPSYYFCIPSYYFASHHIILHPLIFLHHLIILPVSVRSMCIRTRRARSSQTENEIQQLFVLFFKPIGCDNTSRLAFLLCPGQQAGDPVFWHLGSIL